MTDIRAACADDADAIAAIWNPIIRDTTITFTTALATPADVAGAIEAAHAANEPYVVAEANGTILGFARLQPFRGGPGYAHTQELTIHLSPAARGKGLGRKILNSLEKQAHGGGIVSLIAGVSSENDTAIAFHRHLGFETCGTIPKAGRKFGRFLDLILMQKFL